jgi:hypothetical protein
VKISYDLERERGREREDLTLRLLQNVLLEEFSVDEGYTNS